MYIAETISRKCLAYFAFHEHAKQTINYVICYNHKQINNMALDVNTCHSVEVLIIYYCQVFFYVENWYS